MREAGLFGMHNAQVNVTDGRHVYMRAPVPGSETAFEYTLMPTHMLHTFRVRELQDIQLAEPFSFTKGCRTMKIQSLWQHPFPLKTELFDVIADPGQMRPLDDPEAEARMHRHLVRLLEASDAPPEQYARLGLKRP